MCGFICCYSPNGIKPDDEKELLHSSHTLKHRGPDSKNYFKNKNFVAKFFRLAITGLDAAANQPMVSDDGKFILVFNGEIYNYEQIKKTLENQGFLFKTKSDTEVLLKSLIVYRESIIEKLRGMFAFVFYDKSNNLILVARDRFGIKPLYIYKRNNSIFLSSEIKPFLKNNYFNNLNNEKIVNYLSKGWINDSNETIFNGINEISAGKYFIFSSRSLKEISYWDLPFFGTKKFNPDETLAVFHETIKIHSKSDVPFASTLSSGLDSTAIAASLSMIKKDPLATFTIQPPETIEEKKGIDELLNKFHLKYNRIQINKKNILADFYETLDYHDEPFQSSSCIYQYSLRKIIKKHGYKVIFVGEGADEVLGGYSRFIFPFILSLKLKQKQEKSELLKFAENLAVTRNKIILRFEKFKKTIKSASDIENRACFNYFSTYGKKINEKIKNQRFVALNKNYNNIFYDYLKSHLKSHDLPYVLRMEDQNSMANSLEARVPFLDHKFVEHIFSHHSSCFLKDGYTKYMLRKSLENTLPLEICWNRKKLQRPGNDAHFIYKVAPLILKEQLKKNKELCKLFFKKSIAEDFSNDLKIQNPTTSGFWFRLLVFLKWYKKLY